MEEPTSPTQYSREELDKRDRMAITYAKSRLIEGDTLVIVNYPTNAPVRDATGFVLDTTFRVHSSKLLATGSRVFTQMLSQENQQKYRQKPAFKHLYIPKDIEFVLDLTPAKDDDDALELVTSLSCPKGILYWSTSGSRIGIPQKFIDGEDEIVGGRRESLSSQPPITGPTVVNDKNSEFSVVDNYGAELKLATENSLRDVGVENLVEPTVASKTWTKKLPADYCGIRHCAGIERLLQLIEGKDARLNSAPRVWTVAMLANFFDCTGVVVDAVCTWVISQKNGIIIEILPESCLRLGLALRSQLITRAAFAVLVSEEALCIAGQEENVPSKRAPKTPFGRLREDIDDDTLNMIQHAGQSFFDRIDEKVKNLLNEHMLWFTTLPEYYKLQNFELQLSSADPTKTGMHDSALKSIANLQEGLRHYVRGRLFYCLLRQLRPEQAETARQHRFSEQYIPGVPINVHTVYDSFVSQQRVQTKQFWENVRDCGWIVSPGNSNLLYQNLDVENPHYKGMTNLSVASFFKIKKIMMTDLFDCRDEFNLAVLNHETKKKPLSALNQKFTLANISEPAAWEDDEDVVVRHDKVIAYAETFDHAMKLGHDPPPHSYMAWSYRRVRNGFKAPPDSQYFDIYQFMHELSDYISNYCDEMLDRGENRSFTLPETLMCLTDAEYKYLPLFAGGFEDGSGGVYQDELPPAEAGPSGPGPSYHTGFSIASAASSTVDWDDISAGAKSESTIDGWSRDVDDGNTDHIDRRRVGSEVSFGSYAFEGLGVGKGKAVAMSDDGFSVLDGSEAGEYEGKGKGKEVDYDQPATTPQLTALDSLMSDNFFVEGGEEDFNSGDEEDDDFDFMDDSGDDTATEKGDNDDDDEQV